MSFPPCHTIHMSLIICHEAFGPAGASGDGERWGRGFQPQASTHLGKRKVDARKRQFGPPTVPPQFLCVAALGTVNNEEFGGTARWWIFCHTFSSPAFWFLPRTATGASKWRPSTSGSEPVVFIYVILASRLKGGLKTAPWVFHTHRGVLPSFLNTVVNCHCLSRSLANA